MNLHELTLAIEKWADDKGIGTGDGYKQFAKIVEEASEIGLAIIEDDKEEFIDGIGDTYVTITILSKQLNESLDDIVISTLNKNESAGISNIDEAFLFCTNEDNIFVSKDEKTLFTELMVALGQVSSGMNKNNEDMLYNGLTDMFISLTSLSTHIDKELKECVEVAYNVISKRKGKTVNGVFIKEEDLK